VILEDVITTRGTTLKAVAAYRDFCLQVLASPDPGGPTGRGPGGGGRGDSLGRGGLHPDGVALGGSYRQLCEILKKLWIMASYSYFY